MTCPGCGGENDRTARFCARCGASLASAEVASEARKVVTVFFTDVVDSTALGERLDPELLRRVMSRYFDVVQGALERHGGTVEKLVGGYLEEAVARSRGRPSRWTSSTTT